MFPLLCGVFACPGNPALWGLGIRAVWGRCFLSPFWVWAQERGGECSALPTRVAHHTWPEPPWWGEGVPWRAPLGQQCREVSFTEAFGIFPPNCVGAGSCERRGRRLARGRRRYGRLREFPGSRPVGGLGRSQRGSAWAALPPSLAVSLGLPLKSSPGPLGLQRQWGRDLRSISRAGSINHPVTGHPARGGPLQHSFSPPLGGLRSFPSPAGWQGARNTVGSEITWRTPSSIPCLRSPPRAVRPQQGGGAGAGGGPDAPA